MLEGKMNAEGTANCRELLTMDEVQACLGISKAYAYRLVKEGKLRSLRLGERGAIRIRGIDLDAFLESRTSVQPESLANE
jgi:excisionase family DNA binding protein